MSAVETVHLSEATVEALASGRDDLVEEPPLEHLDGCVACADWVARTKLDIDDATLGLRRAMPELDMLDEMVSTAMKTTPDPEWLSSAPSRSSLIGGAAIGTTLAGALAIWSAPNALELGSLDAIGRQAWTLFRAADGFVESAVFGGWATIGLGGLLGALMLALPMRLLLGGREWRGARSILTGTMAVAFLAIVSLPATEARAYRLDGEWPDPEPTVTVDVDATPTSVAIRQAAASAGLGVMVRLENDPDVTLHVEDAPIGEVLEALLGDADVVVRPGSSMIAILVDDAPPPSIAHPTLAIPPVPPMPLVPDVPRIVATGPGVTRIAVNAPPSAAVFDRFTVGEDVVVEEHEQVRSVVTSGGDVLIRGRAHGDIVTTGGDATIMGEVIGDVVTTGGDIRVREGAIIHGDLHAMGGEIDVEEGSTVHGRTVSSPGTDGPDGKWALLNVLVFLLGLVMFSSRRQPFAVLRSEIKGRPLRSALGGLFGLIAGCLLTPVLMFTVVGIPAGVALGALLFVACCVGWTSSAWWLGSIFPVPGLKDRPVAQLALGVGAIFLLGLIPKVGWLLVMVFFMAGLGAVISTSFGRKPRGAKKPVPAPLTR